jgi:hypothetical protein
MFQAYAQSDRKTPVITTSFSKYGTVSGDTTFFNNNSQSSQSGNLLLRYFNRNLRIPFKKEAWEMEIGSCNLFFMIDTAGNVTKCWCDSVTNKAVENEVLRVAGKMTPFKPTTIKGKPVETKVMARVFMVHANENESYGHLKADILVVGYDPVHKKATGR